MMNAIRTDAPQPLSDTHSTVTMSVAAWIAVPDNPRQRDTEKRARVAIQWLSTPSPTHHVVPAGRLPDGSLVKLDGHTRAFLWARHQIPVPVQVRVNIFRIRNLSEAAELYTHFDNIRAAEKATDRTFGAMREIGFEAKGSFVRRCNFAEALRGATAFAQGQVGRHDRTIREYELVRLWRPELELLDTLDPDPREFPGPLVCAFILSMRRRGGKAGEFWLRYKTKDGTRNGRERDSVQALLELMMSNRASRTKLQGYELCGRALSAVEAFIRGDTFTGGLRVVAPENYLPRNKSPLARVEKD